MISTNYAVPPGSYLEEWIDEERLSQQKVADLLGTSRKFVNELVNGHAPVTSETAVKLERVVGIAAETWLRYEASYRADRARIADAENLAAHAADIHPKAAKYLRQFGVTKATKTNPGGLVADFLAFHRCGTWEAFEHQVEQARSGDFALAALKERGSDLEATLLSVWLRAAEMTEIYERGRRFNFSSERLSELLPRLRERVSTPDRTMLDDVANLLEAAGVVFIVREAPEGLPLRGMTRWIDKRVPVIQQTGRWVKDGFVIWALFHEIGHVLNDPRGTTVFEYTTEKHRTDAAEKMANEFARDQLLGPQGLTPFKNLHHNRDIRRVAQEVGISPGLAVYLMHRSRYLDYSFGNSLFVDVTGSIDKSP